MLWRFFGDVSESWLEVVFFENFLGGAAEDHLKCKKRSGIHSDRALLLNALPVPLLRQVYFQWFFRCLFSCCFWKGLFPVFVAVLGGFDAPGGGHFWYIF